MPIRWLRTVRVQKCDKWNKSWNKDVLIQTAHSRNSLRHLNRVLKQKKVADTKSCFRDRWIAFWWVERGFRVIKSSSEILKMIWTDEHNLCDVLSSEPMRTRLFGWDLQKSVAKYLWCFITGAALTSCPLTCNYEFSR